MNRRSFFKGGVLGAIAAAFGGRRTEAVVLSPGEVHAIQGTSAPTLTTVIEVQTIDADSFAARLESGKEAAEMCRNAVLARMESVKKDRGFKRARSRARQAKYESRS